MLFSFCKVSTKSLSIKVCIPIATIIAKGREASVYGEAVVCNKSIIRILNLSIIILLDN